MSEGVFDKPIFVRKKLHGVLEITSVEDAIYFLCDWPKRDQDVSYEFTLKTCCDAYNRLKPIKIAWFAFVDFARNRKILEKPDVVTFSQPPTNQMKAEFKDCQK
ncbi:DUF982 domain-containing protein [Ochrobactrum sp. GPK 3]|uniref:DUF982 domain-containing protein n=1 Tax=Brucella sp. 22210 TaxID=3453892 RepID=UPI0031384BA6